MKAFLYVVIPSKSSMVVDVYADVLVNSSGPSTFMQRLVMLGNLSTVGVDSNISSGGNLMLWSQPSNLTFGKGCRPGYGYQRPCNW